MYKKLLVFVFVFISFCIKASSSFTFASTQSNAMHKVSSKENHDLIETKWKKSYLVIKSELRGTISHSMQIERVKEKLNNKVLDLDFSQSDVERYEIIEVCIQKNGKIRFSFLEKNFERDLFFEETYEVDFNN